MQNEVLKEFLLSWKSKDGMHETSSIIEWVNTLNKEFFVNIKNINLSESTSWYLDHDNIIKNKNGGFFSICGLHVSDEANICAQQPIIVQSEIGYLGIITKKINGLLHLLVQAKIEPGNINKIQLSPTIQATKSNFMQLHKGNKPMYLDYFYNAKKYNIILDQIQSEQSSRFYKKRNRNIMILLDENEHIELSPNHKWMTLGQIKELLKIDNLVNMDMRTVISSIPFYHDDPNCKLLYKDYFSEHAFYESVFSKGTLKNDIFYNINNIKMFSNTKTSLVGLDKLSTWKFSDTGIKCNTSASFEVIFSEIEIEGREVRCWDQPLFKSSGPALFGLLSSVINGRIQFLIKLIPEVGCFDVVELGPTILIEHHELENMNDLIFKFFINKLNNGGNIIRNVMLSEEGGRFYHEENQNVVIMINSDELPEMPNDYFWMDYGQLTRLLKFNNLLNIQLRNLLSLFEV